MKFSTPALAGVMERGASDLEDSEQRKLKALTAWCDRKGGVHHDS